MCKAYCFLHYAHKQIFIHPEQQVNKRGFINCVVGANPLNNNRRRAVQNIRKDVLLFLGAQFKVKAFNNLPRGNMHKFVFKIRIRCIDKE